MCMIHAVQWKWNKAWLTLSEKIPVLKNYRMVRVHILSFDTTDKRVLVLMVVSMIFLRPSRVGELRLTVNSSHGQLVTHTSHHTVNSSQAST